MNRVWIHFYFFRNDKECIIFRLTSRLLTFRFVCAASHQSLQTSLSKTCYLFRSLFFSLNIIFYRLSYLVSLIEITQSCAQHTLPSDASHSLKHSHCPHASFSKPLEKSKATFIIVTVAGYSSERLLSSITISTIHYSHLESGYVIHHHGRMQRLDEMQLDRHYVPAGVAGLLQFCEPGCNFERQITDTELEGVWLR